MIKLRHTATYLLLALVLAACLESSPTEPSTEPTVRVDPTSLRFGSALAEKHFVIANEGGGRLDWAVVVDPQATWCSVRPDAGAGDGEVLVSVTRAGLSPGEHTTLIAVESNAGIVQVRVDLSVTDETGSIIIDTPIPDTGSIIIDTPLPDIEETQ